MATRCSYATAALGAAALALSAAVVVAPPAQADPPDCTDGTYTQWNFTGAVQDCVAPGTTGSGRTISMRVWEMLGGGGGGGGNGDYANGGNGAIIKFDLSIPEGAPVSLYVGGGGEESDNENDTYGDGGGGGGSSAIVVDGVPVAEAGGGGGAQNNDDAGGPNSLDPRKGDDGTTECAGVGGNQALTGLGGAGGPRGAGCVGGRTGFPLAGQSGGDGWSGDGGDGASADGGAARPNSGGWGWSKGGDGGVGSADAEGPSAGSGGGGGYGDGGGGAASGNVNDEAVGSGGGAGSAVRPSVTAKTPTYDIGNNGASEDPGGDGRIAFTMIGPAVVTEAAAPTGVTGTTATTHSTADPNNTMLGLNEITIEYTTDPDFATGVMSVPGDPATLPGGIGDEPVSGSLTGLSPGTAYYYRIVANNGEIATAGEIASFQTPITVTGITPPKGPETGGTEVTVAGTGFRNGTTVTIGGVACTPVAIVSSTSLTCRTGAHAPATVDVVVTNPGPDPQTATLPGAYTYTPGVPDVSVTKAMPRRGPTTGGTEVTITGGGFTVGTTVKIGGTACTPVTVVSTTRLTCVTGAHRRGTVDVIVTVPGGGAATLRDAFTYEPPAPTLAVTAKPRKDRLVVGRDTRVVREVDSNGRVTITAHCTVNGHRLKRSCDITIDKRAGRVTIAPTCNDRVVAHVRVVSRKAGEKETWHRTWAVERTPHVTCAANANG